MSKEAFETRTKAIAQRIANKTVQLWHDEILRETAKYPELKDPDITKPERRHRLKVLTITLETYMLSLLQSSLIINGIRAIDEPTMVRMANEMYVMVARMIQSQYPKLKMSVVISNVLREGGA